jgi:Concanavalin A-like lectin/glucanases superfamily
MTPAQKSERENLKPELNKSRDRSGATREIRNILVFLFFFLISHFSLLSPAFAACSSPAGNAGNMVYNTNYHVLQYCNGGTWVSIGGPVANTTTGLVGWWKLDDGAGTSAADFSGNGNTGTTVNTPTWTTGMNGGALTFNGTNQRVTLANAADLFGTGPATISAWVYPTAFPAPISYIFTGGNTTGFQCAFNAFGNLQSNGHFSCSNDNYFNNAQTASGIFNLNTWYHIAGVRNNAGTVTMYVNGVQSGAANQNAGVVTGGTGNVIGDRVGADGPFPGGIDDARVYSRALSATDIATLYASTGGASGDINSNLVGWWRLDEGSGTTAADSSPNGNTGTATGTTIVAGKISNARSFNGTSDKVNVASYAAFSPGTSDFSISAWVKSSGGFGDFIPASDSNAGTFTQGYGLIIDGGGVGCTSGKIYFAFAAAGTRENHLCSSAPVNDGSWHLITATVQRNSTQSLYVDGVLNASSTTTVTGSVVLPSFALGGAASLWQNYYTGVIDDVRVYNRALSASDVLTLYNTTATACAGPVGYAGDLLYNGAPNHVLQYCNGTNWRPMGKVPGAGGAGCTSPAGNEGNMIYNSASAVLQYCDGTNWRPAR